ncbi:hypothetical protein Trydic_g19243 [Trypoxylus dichotomus]
MLDALKDLPKVKDLADFLDKLNRNFFEKSLVNENLALKITIMQTTWRPTKYKRVTEIEARKFRMKTLKKKSRSSQQVSRRRALEEDGPNYRLDELTDADIIGISYLDFLVVQCD